MLHVIKCHFSKPALQILTHFRQLLQSIYDDEYTFNRQEERVVFFDPRGRPTVMDGGDHCFRESRPSVCPHLAEKKTNFKCKHCPYCQYRGSGRVDH